MARAKARLRRVRGSTAAGALVPCVAIGLAVCATTDEAQAAWNPLAALGGLLGSGVGGFVEAASTPTIKSLESSGDNLIDNLNDKVADREKQLGDTLTGTVSGLDSVAKVRLDQANDILTARVAQVGVVANGVVNSAIGGLDQVAKNRIAQAEQAGSHLIQELDKDETQALDKVDGILQARISQLDDVVGRSLNDVDQILQERIDQVDDVLERRLGTANVMVTKQGVSLEQSAFRIAGLIAALAFLVYVLREVYNDFLRFWRMHEKEERHKQVALALGKTLGFVALRVGAAGACLFVLSAFLKSRPSVAQQNLDAVVADAEKSFGNSRSALDFSRIRFYASQLADLESDGDRREAYRREARKFEVCRSILSRPALLRTSSGVRGVTDELNALVQLAPNDSDLVTMQAYVTYRASQASPTRAGDDQAAELADRALSLGADGTRAPVLKPLAAAVLRAVLNDPVPGSQIETKFAVYEARLVSSGDATFGPLESSWAYDDAVAQLDEQSTNAFIDMAGAEADSVAAVQALPKSQKPPKLDKDGNAAEPLSDPQSKIASARKARLDAARRVIAAWTAFDARLSSSELAGSNAVLAAFELNDAVLTQALWFDADPNVAEPAPRVSSIDSIKLRMQVSPVRIEWARRYMHSLDRSTGRMVGMQESQRFIRYEDQVAAFLEAFVKARTGSAEDPKTATARSAAALDAATLGLYQGPKNERRAYGVTLLGAGADASAQSDVAAEYQKRHLRYL